MTFAAIVCLIAAAVLAVLLRRQKDERRAAELKNKLLEDEVRLARDASWRTELLRRLVEGIDDGLLIAGADLRVLFVNRGAARFLPVAADPLGLTLLECVRDHRIADFVAAARADGRRAREEFVLTSTEADGSLEERSCSVEAVPLNGDTPPGQQKGVLVILRDETDKRAVEKIRRDFVANASHELRTPLSIINGYLENLASGDLSDPDQIQRAYAVMRKHADRLARIVEDMLLISRMESGQAEALRIEPIDLQSCALDVVQLLSNMIAAQDARVSVAVADGCNPQIEGDRFYWEQIFFNLVENALKENPGKGLQIAIRICKADKGRLEIEVADNGVGIPHGDLPFIFKRFYRVSGRRPKEVKGTGLGLSIVKRAVEAHRGTISVRSQPGIETVFAIHMPRKTWP